MVLTTPGETFDINSICIATINSNCGTRFMDICGTIAASSGGGSIPDTFLICPGGFTKETLVGFDDLTKFTLLGGEVQFTNINFTIDAAPEIDGASAAIPVALASGLLLLLADRRRPQAA
jgi:hypothetical protein